MSRAIAYYIIDPPKKIEVFIINNRDKEMREIVKSVISARKIDTAKFELAKELSIFIVRRLRIKKGINRIKTSPLINFSRIILINHKYLRSGMDIDLVELSPLELLSPIKLTTIIFYKKIKLVFSRKTMDFLELMLREARTLMQVIISLLIALYFDYLPRKRREVVEKYFLMNKDFWKTLLIAALYYLKKEIGTRIIVRTKKTYFKEKYLAGYSPNELPLGTKLIVIDKTSSYIWAKKLGSELGKTYVLHIDEIEIVSRQQRIDDELEVEINGLLMELGVPT